MPKVLCCDLRYKGRTSPLFHLAVQNAAASQNAYFIKLLEDGDG